MTRLLHGVCGLCLLCAMAPLSAQQQVTIYRCTDAAGALTLQNDQPCPAGDKQETQVIDVPPPLPAYRTRAERMPDIVAAEEAKRDAAIERAKPKPVPVAERIAPAPLFQCTTWNDERYFTEDDTPAERCAPLRIVGMDGRARPGLGSACQTVRDKCEAIAETELCTAWRRRVDEAEFRWKFAGARDNDPRRIEYERHAAVLANSACRQ